MNFESLLLLHRNKSRQGAIFCAGVSAGRPMARPAQRRGRSHWSERCPHSCARKTSRNQPRSQKNRTERPTTRQQLERSSYTNKIVHSLSPVRGDTFDWTRLDRPHYPSPYRQRLYCKMKCRLLIEPLHRRGWNQRPKNLSANCV